MQLKHFKNVLAAGAGVSKVTAVAWAPNNTRLAVVTSDRVVHLIDENGERRDKFATKQGDPKASVARSWRSGVHVHFGMAGFGQLSVRLPFGCCSPGVHAEPEELHRDRDGVLPRFDQARHRPERLHRICVQGEPP
jgi:hypothetical protein